MITMNSSTYQKEKCVMNLNLRAAIIHNVSGNNQDELRDTIVDAIQGEKKRPYRDLVFSLKSSGKTQIPRNSEWSLKRWRNLCSNNNRNKDEGDPFMGCPCLLKKFSSRPFEDASFSGNELIHIFRKGPCMHE